MLSALLDFFFPPRCPSCRACVERRGFCPACARQLIGMRRMMEMGAMAEHLTGVWVLAHYRAGVRDLLRALK